MYTAQNTKYIFLQSTFTEHQGCGDILGGPGVQGNISTLMELPVQKRRDHNNQTHF